MPKATRKTQNAPVGEAAPGFEVALGELEQLVERLEGGELSLEDALNDFERGVALTRHCQRALASAELRVQQLLQRDGKEQLEDFEAGDNDA